jgi:hypothetical protein
MRFKKLKIFVGITILLFILIVGDIIAFGLIQKSGNFASDDINIIAPVDNKKNSPNSTLQLPPGAQPIIPTGQPPAQVQPTPLPQQPPAIVNKGIITRAS